jgi:inhibitor of KinA sporulation pathway (predicted exonuclease)
MVKFKHLFHRNIVKPALNTTQKYDYIIILDFEATCGIDFDWDNQEIIDFSAILFNTQTLQIESKFDSFVKPQIYKKLTPFCSHMTSITQKKLDNAKKFRYVMIDYIQWMITNRLIDTVTFQPLLPNKFTFVICGDWDLKTMLPKQCNHIGMEYPDFFGKWIDLTQAYYEYCWKNSWTPSTCVKLNRMLDILRDLNITHTGTLHRAVDDSMNMTKIVNHMICDNYVF